MVIVVEVEAVNIIEILVAWFFWSPTEIHEAGQSATDRGRNDAADGSKNSDTGADGKLPARPAL